MEFCKNTWPGGDYIPEVWDDWLRDKRGRLVVAATKTGPVGIAHAWFQSKRLAWLEGVRVHPSYRGQGLAGRLNKALTGFAARQGATTARLCTGSQNSASRRHLDKTGFKLLLRFQRLESHRPLRNKPRSVVRLRKHNPRVWQWITAQLEFKQFHQMYSDGWTWYPLTSSALAKFLSQRGIISTGSALPTSCSLFSQEEKHLTIGFTAGVSEEVAEHGRFLRTLLVGQREKVRALVPKGSKLVSSLESAGFEKNGTILVYEKPLGSSTSQKP